MLFLDRETHLLESSYLVSQFCSGDVTLLLNHENI